MLQPLARVTPAQPHRGVKRRASAAVDAAASEILDLSHRIHADPEPAFEERQAATWVAEAVARHGYAVEHPAGRLETAGHPVGDREHRCSKAAQRPHRAHLRPLRCAAAWTNTELTIPGVFKRALDVRAHTINEEMSSPPAHAIATVIRDDEQLPSRSSRAS